MIYDFIKKQIQEDNSITKLLQQTGRKHNGKHNSKDKKTGKYNTSDKEYSNIQRDSSKSKREVSKDKELYQQSSSETSKVIRTSFEDYLNELRQKFISQIKKQWLTPNPNKKYLSVTEVIGCPLQTWLKLSGSLTPSDIEDDKIFYLLVLYGKIGDVIHDEIYKTMFFEHTEKMVYDKQNFLRGKFDIIDNNFLIDIKSSREKSNHAPQLSLYLHLAKLAGYNINRVGIWYVLRDEIEEYDMSYIESLIPKYLERARLIKKHLESKTPPQEIDEEHCKYCLVQNKCKQILSQLNNNPGTTRKENNDKDDIILQFDIKF